VGLLPKYVKKKFIMLSRFNVLKLGLVQCGFGKRGYGYVVSSNLNPSAFRILVKKSKIRRIKGLRRKSMRKPWGNSKIILHGVNKLKCKWVATHQELWRFNLSREAFKLCQFLNLCNSRIRGESRLILYLSYGVEKHMHRDLIGNGWNILSALSAYLKSFKAYHTNWLGVISPWIYTDSFDVSSKLELVIYGYSVLHRFFPLREKQQIMNLKKLFVLLYLQWIDTTASGLWPLLSLNFCEYVVVNLLKIRFKFRKLKRRRRGINRFVQILDGTIMVKRTMYRYVRNDLHTYYNIQTGILCARSATRSNRSNRMLAASSPVSSSVSGISDVSIALTCSRLLRGSVKFYGYLQWLRRFVSFEVSFALLWCSFVGVFSAYFAWWHLLLNQEVLSVRVYLRHLLSDLCDRNAKLNLAIRGLKSLDGEIVHPLQDSSICVWSGPKDHATMRANKLALLRNAFNKFKVLHAINLRNDLKRWLYLLGIKKYEHSLLFVASNEHHFIAKTIDICLKQFHKGLESEVANIRGEYAIGLKWKEGVRPVVLHWILHQSGFKNFSILFKSLNFLCVPRWWQNEHSAYLPNHALSTYVVQHDAIDIESFMLRLLLIRNKLFYRVLKRLDSKRVGTNFLGYMHTLRIHMESDLYRYLGRYYTIKFNFLRKHNITSELLCEYILIRLRKRDRVKVILKDIKKRVPVQVNIGLVNKKVEYVKKKSRVEFAKRRRKKQLFILRKCRRRSRFSVLRRRLCAAQPRYRTYLRKKKGFKTRNCWRYRLRRWTKFKSRLKILTPKFKVKGKTAPLFKAFIMENLERSVKPLFVDLKLILPNAYFSMHISLKALKRLVLAIPFTLCHDGVVKCARVFSPWNLKQENLLTSYRAYALSMVLKGIKPWWTRSVIQMYGRKKVDLHSKDLLRESVLSYARFTDNLVLMDIYDLMVDDLYAEYKQSVLGRTYLASDNGQLYDWFHSLGVDSSRLKIRTRRRFMRGQKMAWLQLGEMLEGYKIECRGMFVRRHSNRSQSFIVQRGNVSINNRSENVEYLKKNITLRTGACSVRVWLLRKHDNTILEA
jgi:hypothetical protein